jgi:signal transduction histidine kinase
MYDQEDFEANIAFLAKTNDYFVQIVSEKDMQVLLSVNNQGENAAPQQDDIVDETLFQRLDESDGICQYYVKDDVRTSNWVVQAVVLANIDGAREVLVVSKSLADVDALMRLLTSRYLLVTVTVLILASILSICLAIHFSRPFQHLNKSAQQMAAGDYKTVFVREGPVEARQLADTLEQAEQEFNKTESLRRDFVANVSHDMKTPLTVIRMYAEMLEAFSGEIPEKREEHVRMILDETDRLTNFISDTLDLAKLQSGTMEMEETVFSIRGVAEEVLSSVCANRPEFHFKLECMEDVQVQADRRLIYRVIYNFASNAVKYSTEGGTIQIRVKQEKHKAVLIVEDQGIGMAEEELPLIFERFYRTDLSRSRKTGGAGIGLAIVKAIVQAHQGTVTVTSKVGCGSRFTVTLPAGEETR